MNTKKIKEPKSNSFFATTWRKSTMNSSKNHNVLDWEPNIFIIKQHWNSNWNKYKLKSRCNDIHDQIETNRIGSIDLFVWSDLRLIERNIQFYFHRYCCTVDIRYHVNGLNTVKWRRFTFYYVIKQIIRKKTHLNANKCGNIDDDDEKNPNQFIEIEHILQPCIGNDPQNKE